MTEAGQILPVIARTFGFSGDNLITLTWSLDVAQFTQELTLISFLGFSLFPLLKITRRPLAKNIPHIILMGAFVVVWLQLMI
jgi:hypothetical protein